MTLLLLGVGRATAAGSDTTVITEGDTKLTVESLAPISAVTITEGDTKLTLENA
jgi:hypothetical protein